MSWEPEEEKKMEREESWRTAEPSKMSFFEPKFSKEQEVLYDNMHS